MAERFDVGSVFERRLGEARQALEAFAVAMEMNLPKAHAALSRVRVAIDGAESASVLLAVWKGSRAHELSRIQIDTLRVALARLLERWFPALAEAIQMVRLDEPTEPPLFAGAAEIERADLSGANLSGSVLRDVRAAEARLDRLEAVRASWKSCAFVASSAVAARLDGSGLDACDFSRANLARSSWRGANAVACRFSGAVLFDADIHHAVFVECDFRGVDLGARLRSLDSSRAFFYRCDLRETAWGQRDLAGVQFVECKMFGVHGRPQLGDVTIVNPDTSPAGDGTGSDPQEVYASWCS